MRWPWRRDEIVCQQFVELVTDYLEGVLPRPQRVAIDRHLTACDGCTAYLEQMRMTLAVAGRLERDDVPDEVVDAVMRALDDFRSRE